MKQSMSREPDTVRRQFARRTRGCCYWVRVWRAKEDYQQVIPWQFSDVKAALMVAEGFSRDGYTACVQAYATRVYLFDKPVAEVQFSNGGVICRHE